MYVNKHRSQEQIIADILSVVEKEPKKTHIMYGANLSYTLLCKYLDRLLGAGLVKYRRKDRVYELTNRGEHYLDRYGEYKTLEDALTQNESAFNEKKAALTEILEG